MTITVVYEKQLAEMAIRVTDAAGVRTLWLNETPQSQMLLERPMQLITPYEQVMASWALFFSTEKTSGQALVLGVGGGSAIKHLNHYYPAWEITAIEYSDQMAAIAYEHFSLPKSDKLTVLIEDAFALVANPHQLECSHYDLLLVDLFDAERETTYDYARSFWAHCLELMTERSVLAINLWAKDQAHFKAVLQQIGDAFTWRVLVVPVAGSSNVVVFAFHPDGAHYSLETLERQAIQLSTSMQFPAQEYLQQMITQNKPQLDRCILV